MHNFFCNKRYDISFSDFHRLIKLVLPTNYTSRETRGYYRKDYVPCNIIALKNKEDELSNELNIYCWLGAKGLTVLAEDELTAQISFEVLKEVKQNPEEFKSTSFDLNNFTEEQFLELIDTKEQFSIYKQLKVHKGIDKYIIREYNSDEVEVLIEYERNRIVLSGTYSSLYTYIHLIIEKIINSNSAIQNESD